jgi:hypothetical protein
MTSFVGTFGGSNGSAAGPTIWLIVTALALLAACDNPQPKGIVYTLYRNSPAFPDMRINVATFDASDDNDYNQTNCELTRELFASKAGVAVHYWCERGRFTE